MMMISRHDFESLARASGDLLVSIYLPTHRRGRETEEDRIRLKNGLQELERRLEASGRDAESIAPQLAELRRLLDDIEFWRHQGDGLAIFLSPEGMRMHRLAVPVEEAIDVGRRFLLRPLLPAVSDHSRFHVLALALHSVRLLECTRTTVREVDAHDLPDDLRDVVGYDWEEKSLQFHTRAAPAGAASADRSAMHHGQGAGEDDDARERERFLRAVDRGLHRLLEGRHAPLVLAADEREMSMYRALSRHPQVLDGGVPGNPEHRSAEQLHAAALEVAAPALEVEARIRRERIAEAAHSDRVATGIAEVLPAALDGRVDTLLVDCDGPIWGAFDPEDRRVRLHESREPRDEDLLDRVVAEAVRTGAAVVPASRSEVPSGRRVAAMLRF